MIIPTNPSILWDGFDIHNSATHYSLSLSGSIFKHFCKYLSCRGIRIVVVIELYKLASSCHLRVFSQYGARLMRWACPVLGSKS